MCIRDRGYRTYNMPFMMRELQIANRAACNTIAGPDDIPCSLIRKLPDVALTTLLALYNVIRMHEDHLARWKKAFFIPPLKAG